jgi:hypothetical protein
MRANKTQSPDPPAYLDSAAFVSADFVSAFTQHPPPMAHVTLPLSSTVQQVCPICWHMVPQHAGAAAAGLEVAMVAGSAPHALIEIATPVRMQPNMDITLKPCVIFGTPKKKTMKRLFACSNDAEIENGSTYMRNFAGGDQTRPISSFRPFLQMPHIH